MKILALSDTQIGSGTQLTDDRVGEQDTMLTQIADLGERERVDLVVHCGDVFDKRHPSEEARLAFKRFVARVVDERPLLICSGNHDLRNADLPSALDLYDGCAFVRSPGVRQFADVYVACLPWVPLGRRISARNGSREGIYEETADLLVQVAADLREKCTGGVAVLALHWMLSGARLPNGLPVEQLGSVVLPTSELEAQGWDAIFAGDIHVPENIGTDAPIISCGSPWVNDFGEADIEHGVWIYDTQHALAGPEFVTVEDAHRFVTVDVDLTSQPELGLDETDSLAAAVASRFPVEDAVLRIRYKATPEQARQVDTAAIRKLCSDAGAHRLYELKPIVEPTQRARLEGVTEVLTVREALDLYLASKAETIAADRAEELRQLNAQLAEELAA